MTRTAQSPKLARWLLEHFGCSPNNAAVVGDLDERYRQGRSGVWYWWQVTAAVVAGFITEIRIRKLIVLRGLLLGMAFQLLFWYGMHFLLHLMPYQWYWEHPHVLPRTEIWIAAVACALNGRILGWLHRSSGRIVLFTFTACQFITGLVPVDLVRYRLSWIFPVGGGINTWMWNSYGMTALSRICDACTKFPNYGVLLSIASSLITAMLLLVGSGVLRANTSGASYDTSTAT